MKNEVKVKLQEAGMAMFLFGLVGLVVYMATVAPILPMALIVVGVVIFAAGKVMP